MAIELGQYQNEIKSLSALDLENYERIFKIFPKTVDNKEFYVYNILKNIEIPEIDSNYIDYYTTNGRLPLTTLSYNIYGDIKSWWILYLLNKDKFNIVPFYIDGGVQIKYIKNEYRTAIYNDITNSTIYDNRHY